MRTFLQTLIGEIIEDIELKQYKSTMSLSQAGISGSGKRSKSFKIDITRALM